MTKEKLLELLKDMSLEEKIGQLVQLPPELMGDDAMATGPAQSMGITYEQIYECGSTLTVTGAEKLKKIQDKVLSTQPHKIPMLFMADIINGYRTIYPIPLAQGASFDTKLSEECARMAAKESSYDGLHVTFSPMADLVKDSRWGRVMESTGESVFLNSEMGKAMIVGYQGKDMTEEGSMAACVKHFAAYGAPMGGRDYNTVELDERTLKDEYLPAYEAAIKAGVALTMTSFNTINRVPSTANKWLMRDILRDKMGFKGVLISDWGAIGELVNHAVAADKKEAARLALEAGVDIDMCTESYFANTKALIDEGLISEELLDECVLRILELKNDLGLFENPYRFADEAKAKECILSKENRALARKAAGQSMVLLENHKSILPLSEKSGKVAFIGPYVDCKHLYGFWSLWGRDEDTASVRETVDELIKAGELSEKPSFAQGSNFLKKGEKLVQFGGYADIPENEDEEGMLNEALSLAKEADTVVMLLGEHAFHSGEAGSRTDIRLPKPQRKLLDEVSKVNKNIVTVVFSGRPLDLRDVKKRSKAVLEAWFPGTEGAAALLDVLYGKVNPSGKVPMTFPRNVGQLPMCYNELPTGRPNNGDDTNRAMSRYLDVANTPLYPFGYGLSYTKFDISPVTLSSDTLTKDTSITASVKVTNTGKVTGSEVVQLYIRDKVASVSRPVKEHKGFEKICLKPGEEKTVEFVITEDMLRFTTINNVYESEPGSFDVFVGNSSATDNKAEFILK